MHTALRIGLAFALVLTGAACSRDVPTTPVAQPLAAGVGPAADKQVAPSSGVLSLCKQAGAGITAGTPFTFGVSLGGVLRSASVAAGGCVAFDVPRESVPLGKGYFKMHPEAVAPLVPAGATLAVGDAALSSAQIQAILGGGSGVTASSNLLLNLAQQLVAAELNVLRGVQPSAAVLQTIADANAALQITIVGSTIQLATPRTTPQLSALVDPLSDFNDGKTKPPATPASVDVRIVEAAAGAHVTVTSIACAPASQCANADFATRSVTATVASGATTTVTYTNAMQTVLRVCKVAGPGIAAGTVFHFGAALLANTSGSASFDVPAGGCRDAEVAPGSYALQEMLPADGIAVTAIDCAPALRCNTPNLANGFVIPTVVDASTTTVTYTNRSTIGTLRVCKVAGPGIAAGTVFHFSAVQLGLHTNTASFDVPAGECRDAALPESPYTIRETTPTGTSVTAIECAPATACESPKLADGFVIATVTAQSTTTVTYANRSTLGTLRVCMAPGSGLVPGSAFEVHVVRLGPVGTGADFAVGVGQCHDAELAEGGYAVMEEAASGLSVLAITCDPPSACESVAPGGRSVVVALAAQSTLTVTFVNAGPAMLRAPNVRSSP